MSYIYFTHRENLFNDLVGQRVRVTIKNLRNRERVYVGTFKAFDYFVNVVLADAYRVVLNSTEEQRQDVNGLMLIRGSHIKTIKYEHRERSMARWPTQPKQTSKKTERLLARKEKSEISAPPAPASKPLKLKRSWLTSGSIQNSQIPQTVIPIDLGQGSRMEKETAPMINNIQNLKIMTEQSSIDKGNAVEKSEITIKEEWEDPMSPTFEEILHNYDSEEHESVSVKSENCDSSGSDMSLST